MAKKPVQKPAKASLSLPASRNADGSKDTTLWSTIGKTYDTVELYTLRGTKPVATLVSTNADDVINVGSATKNFVFSLLNAFYAGKGASPDGSALWIKEHCPAVYAHWSDKFPTYRLVVRPKSGARASANLYEGTIADMVAVVMGKATIIEASIKKHGAVKKNTRAAADAEEVPVGISL